MAEGLFAGKYRLLGRLGAGGWCDVFRARQDELDRTVAIKWLRQDLAATPDVSRRFEREAHLCAKLRHPNVTQIYEVGDHEGRPFIAMELVEGEDLRARLVEGLPLGRGLGLLAQVADALDHAHGQGVVHRDLKPENVLIDRRGQAKVADWGMARAFTETGAGGDRLTRAGIIMGTPAYLAPEQIRGLEPTAATDLYALGIMLFELATGRPPFVEPSTMALIDAHLSTSPPQLELLAPGVPPALAELVSALLAKDPTERPAPAGAVAKRLRSILAPAARAPTPTVLRGAKAPPPARRTARRRTLVPGLAAAGLLAVLLLVAWREGSSAGPPRGPVQPTLLKVSLRALDRLEVRWRGPLDAPLSVALFEADGRTAARVSVAPGGRRLVPPDGAVGEARLPQPLVAPAVASCGEAGSSTTFPLDPAPLLARALEPLTAIERPQLADLLRAAMALRPHVVNARSRGTALPATAPARLHEVLDRAGLGRYQMEPLRPLLEAVLGSRPPLDSPTVRALLPLRAVEAFIGEEPSLVPWPPVTPSLEHHWNARDATKPGPGTRSAPPPPPVVPGLHLVAAARIVPSDPGYDPAKGPARVWLGSPAWLNRTRGTGRIGRSVNFGARLYGPAAAAVERCVETTTLSFDVPPGLRPWPPRTASLGLSGFLFCRENMLCIKLNDGPEATVVNGSSYTVREPGVGEQGLWFAAVRSDPARLRVGRNHVTLRLEELPGLTATLGVGIEGVRLFTDGEP